MNQQVTQLFENQIDSNKLLTKKQLCEALRISPATLQRLMRDGLTEGAGVLVRSSWRFDLTRVWHWLKQKEQKAHG